ncbi:hypothetical protein M8C21_032789 [Ambrosia artemisiifolia]|uniref:Uncharacterized protein n=1 Tax=Ambrosia artemisiifolia TaxID=4212 RepID=A0AAD5CXR5_AMBAR|nr:hypothetical protein M8C21_032789 [Ambrosia artemisiifolia]
MHVIGEGVEYNWSVGTSNKWRGNSLSIAAILFSSTTSIAESVTNVSIDLIIIECGSITVLEKKNL